jgi:hypothetical protein
MSTHDRSTTTNMQSDVSTCQQTLDAASFACVNKPPQDDDNVLNHTMKLCRVLTSTASIEFGSVQRSCNCPLLSRHNVLCKEQAESRQKSTSRVPFCARPKPKVFFVRDQGPHT